MTWVKRPESPYQKKIKIESSILNKFNIKVWNWKKKTNLEKRCKPPHKHRIESNETLTSNENSEWKEMNKW